MAVLATWLVVVSLLSLLRGGLGAQVCFYSNIVTCGNSPCDGIAGAQCFTSTGGSLTLDVCCTDGSAVTCVGDPILFGAEECECATDQSCPLRTPEDDPGEGNFLSGSLGVAVTLVIVVLVGGLFCFFGAMVCDTNPFAKGPQMPTPGAGTRNKMFSPGAAYGPDVDVLDIESEADSAFPDSDSEGEDGVGVSRSRALNAFGSARRGGPAMVSVSVSAAGSGSLPWNSGAATWGDSSASATKSGSEVSSFRLSSGNLQTAHSSGAAGQQQQQQEQQHDDGDTLTLDSNEEEEEEIW